MVRGRTASQSEPGPEAGEGVGPPAEVHRVGVGPERALVADEVVVHVVDGLGARRGAREVEQPALHGRIVEARAAHEEARLAGAPVELLLHEVGERIDVARLPELGDRLLHALGRRRPAVVPVDPEPAARHVELVVDFAAPREARVHGPLAQPAQPRLGEIVDRRLERQEAAVLLLPPLARGDHDGLVAQGVEDPPLRVHELRRDQHALAERVVEAVEEGPLAPGGSLLDRPQPPEVVGEAHAHVEPAEVARRPGDDAQGVAFAVDGGVGAQAGEAGRRRRLEARPAPLQRRAARGIAHDHINDGAAAGPARGGEVGGGDLQAALAGSEDEGAADRGQPGAPGIPGPRFNLDRPREGPCEDEGQSGPGRRLELADAQVSLLARGPQDGSREKGVLVLPVVPVRAGLHRVDGLGNQAVAHGGEGHHPALPVGAGGDHGKPGRLDDDVASRLVAVEAAATRPRGQQGEVEALGDRVRPRPPLRLHDRLPVELRVAAVADAVVGHAHERRDLPDAKVALLLVAQERVPQHVSDEGVEQHEARPFADPPQDRVARLAGVARPAVEARDHQHLERLRARELLLDVAVDDAKVVLVPAQHVVAVVVVADAPAVDVPAAVDGHRGGLEGEPLHQLDHVAPLRHGRDEEAADGPAGERLRPGHVRRHDLGRVGDVVARRGLRLAVERGRESGEGEPAQGAEDPARGSSHAGHRNFAAPRFNRAAESRSR